MGRTRDMAFRELCLYLEPGTFSQEQENGCREFLGRMAGELQRTVFVADTSLSDEADIMAMAQRVCGCTMEEQLWITNAPAVADVICCEL